MDFVAALSRRLTAVARRLTTPLQPEDYLGLFDPLWSYGELRGRIEAVHPETADAVTLVIRPGRGWAPHRAGQWVRIGVDVDGRRHWRTFSLSSPPGRPDGRVTITVKSNPDGVVSAHLVRGAAPGTIVRLSTPGGDFVLPDPPPPRVLFLTAGSGITPVMAMLEDILACLPAEGGRRSTRTALVPGGLMPGCRAGAGILRVESSPENDGRLAPDVVLVHSVPTPDDVIFGTRLRELAATSSHVRLHERHTRTQGRLGPPDLATVCPDWTERAVWACGPAAMLDELAACWTGPQDRLHIERFGPPVPPQSGPRTRPRIGAVDGAGGCVRFTRSGRAADSDGRTPLLIVGEEAGVLMPSGCRMGICHGCVARLCSGQVRDLRTNQIHGEPGDLIQTCVSAAAGPVEIEL